MHAFWCGTPRLAGARLDAKLVDLDVPVTRWRELLERCPAGAQDCGGAVAGGDLRQHWVEPARNAPVQGIVIAALIMRLMRFTMDRFSGAGPESGEAPF